MLLRSLAVLFFSAGIVGCGTQESILATGEPLVRPDYGLVAGTLGYKAENRWSGFYVSPPSLVAEFYSVGDKQKPAFVLNTATAHAIIGLWDVPSARLAVDGEIRIMSLVPVKPGKYRMGRLRAYFWVNERKLELDAINPRIVEVRENEVVYVGNIGLPTLFGKGLLGQAIPVSSSLTVNDDFETDITGMKAVDARLNTLKIHNGLK